MFEIYKLDTKEGAKKYKSLLPTFDKVAPYFLIDYIGIFGGGYKNLICFLYKNNKTGAVIFMPGYLKPIVIGGEETDYFDFTTPYGYTGPCFSKEVLETDIFYFWKIIDNWYVENKVVSEFVRFNLSNSHLHYSGKCLQSMLNIKGKIIDKESQWSSFDYKVRKNVNKAKREKLTCNIFFSDIEDTTISDFFNIYTNTMIRTKADKKFFYSFENFKYFIKNNKQYCAICTVYFDGRPISTELILKSNDSIYSFLGGTNEKYFYKRPNDFLKVELINWARNNNIKYYVLGGGYGFEDGIFKYKKSFFPNDVVNYYTGRKIINEEIYDKLCLDLNDRRKFIGLSVIDKSDELFFPLYRIDFENYLK